MKKAILWAMTAAAVVAFAAPTAASANWTHEGVPLENGENPHVLFEGPVEFIGQLGRVSCKEASSTVELTGGANYAHLLTFTIDEPESCAIEGLLEALCGAHSLTAGHLEHPATGLDEGGTIEVSNLEFVTQFGECFEAVLTDDPEGSFTATPDRPEAVGDLTLSATLADSLGTFEAFSGELQATPAGTYGLE